MKPLPRLLTGDRPTGRLHLGHYIGTLKNRVRLQEQYETFLIIADLHLLTTKNTRDDIKQTYGFAKDMVLDQLAAGIDPERVTFFLQSGVPEICELNTLFQNLVTVSRLERIPSLKDMCAAAGREEMPYGLLGYPVLQAADILCLKANLVPVGKDNVAHVEVAKEIARRFNFLYGECFPEPGALVGDVPTLTGTDGKEKMSKSLNNAIFLSDTAEEVTRKVRGMYTDPKRIRADIPGTVEGNPVFEYLDAFCLDTALVDSLKERYRAGTVGDAEVKRTLTGALNTLLEPMRARRAQYEAMEGYVEHLIVTGTKQVRQLVQGSLDDVKGHMGFSEVKHLLQSRADAYDKK